MQDKSETKRLSKALAAAGVASRRASEALIFAGRVTVNGEIVRIPQTQISWTTDRIHVDGKEVHKEEVKKIYLFHKPSGVICSNVRVGKKPIVLDFFPEGKERLFTVGRLDSESEGLILVTNDGHFANQVAHPSSGILKEYIVKTAQEITAKALKDLARGAFIDGRRHRPVSVTKVRRGTFRIILKEGKKHEVRLFAEQARLDVLELKRVRIGTLLLGLLPPGHFRSLTVKERELLLYLS